MTQERERITTELEELQDRPLWYRVNWADRYTGFAFSPEQDNSYRLFLKIPKDTDPESVSIRYAPNMDAYGNDLGAHYEVTFKSSIGGIWQMYRVPEKSGNNSLETFGVYINEADLLKRFEHVEHDVSSSTGFDI